MYNLSVRFYGDQKTVAATKADQMRLACYEILKENGIDLLSDKKAFDSSSEVVSDIKRNKSGNGIFVANISSPFKTSIIEAFGNELKLDEIAERTGAVNAVYYDDNLGYVATNSDPEAAVQPILKREGMDIFYRRRLLILGAGGASRAAIVGANQYGMPTDNIFIYNNFSNRSKNRLSELCDVFSCRPVEDIAGLDESEINHLINATPIGKEPYHEQMPLDEESLDMIVQKGLKIALDMNYTPHPSKLLRYLGSKGVETIDGREMAAITQIIILEKVFESMGLNFPSDNRSEMIDLMVKSIGQNEIKR